MPKKDVKLLDCTIRDGGYLNNWDFPRQMVKDVFRQLTKAGVDIIEVGFRDGSNDGPLWRRCPESELATIASTFNRAKLAVMVDYGKAESDHFSEASDSYIDLVRVAVHRDKIKNAIRLLGQIKKKGYLTSIQLMGYSLYSEQEKSEAIRMLLDKPPDYVYVADSYGSLFPEMIKPLLEPLVSTNAFKVGFHAHNNLQLAFANTLEAIKSGVDIIDSTLYGMGRGAGNLATESILAYMQQRYGDKFNVIYSLFCVDTYISPIKKKINWGYQLPYMLSGFCECHPSYAKNMVQARRYMIDDVWKALNIIKRKNPVGYAPKLLQDILDDGAFEYTDSKSIAANIPINQKKGQSITVSSPGYLNRYEGRKFLILANGPSLKRERDDVEAFIKKYDPIVLGANYLEGLFKPHYHAFTNKKRYVKYVKAVDRDSKILLSCYFGNEFIREYTQRNFEELCFQNGDRNDFEIKKGIISNDCSSVSMLLLAVAIVMGASDLFVAGMDGYVHPDEHGNFYFYQEEDVTSSKSFNISRQRWGKRTLKLIDAYAIKKGLSGVNIITTTSYDQYYISVKNLI